MVSRAPRRHWHETAFPPVDPLPTVPLYSQPVSKVSLRSSVAGARPGRARASAARVWRVMTVLGTCAVALSLRMMGAAAGSGATEAVAKSSRGSVLDATHRYVVLTQG